MFSSPSLVSDSLEGGAAKAEVELQRAKLQVRTRLVTHAHTTEAPYGGEELRPACLLLAGERERDLDLERERLREDLDLLLDLEGCRSQQRLMTAVRVWAAARGAPVHTWTWSRSGSGSASGSGSGSGSESGTARTWRSQSWSERRTCLCCETDSWMRCLQGR